MTDSLSISDIDDAWHALPESTKFTLWLAASSAALGVKAEYLQEWINIVNKAKPTLLG